MRLPSITTYSGFTESDRTLSLIPCMVAWRMLILGISSVWSSIEETMMRKKQQSGRRRQLVRWMETAKKTAGAGLDYAHRTQTAHAHTAHDAPRAYRSMVWWSTMETAWWTSGWFLISSKSSSLR